MDVSTTTTFLDWHDQGKSFHVFTLINFFTASNGLSISKFQVFNKFFEAGTDCHRDVACFRLSHTLSDKFSIGGVYF